jgi:ADP-ribose pyrophosphatase
LQKERGGAYAMEPSPAGEYALPHRPVKRGLRNRVVAGIGNVWDAVPVSKKCEIAMNILPPSSHTEYPRRPRVAVGAVVFRNNHVLLVRRGRPPAENVWAIPGGKVRLGESLQQAAEREILEETGIRIRAGSPVFVFDHLERDPDGRVRFHYVIVDLSAEYVEGEILAGDDALDARWVDAGALNQLAISRQTRRLLQECYGFSKPS